MKKWFNNLKIGFKLMLIVTLIVIIACVPLATTAAVIASNDISNEVIDKMNTAADDAAKLIKSEINYYFAQVENTAENEHIKAMDWETVKPMLKAKAEKLGIIKMGIADLKGDAVYSNDSSTNIAQRAYFKNALEGKTNISDPLMSTAENTTVVVIATPIYNGDKVVGVMLATMEDKFISTIVNETNSGETGYAFMLSSTGTTIAHPDTEMVINANNDIENAKEDASLAGLAAIEQKMIAGETGNSEYSYNGVKSSISYIYLEDFNWALGISIPQKEIFSSITTLIIILVSTTIVVIIIALLIMLKAAKSLVTKPINKISDVANTLATGDVSIDVDGRYKDEIGLLLSAFGKMIKNIRTQAENAQKISEGNLNFEIVESSDKDQLALSMKEMMRSLKELTSDSQMLVDAAIEGHLDVRADAEKHRGAYQDIINGINNTLDAVVTPLNRGLNQLDLLASGKDTEAIENTYKGAFHTFVENLNKLQATLTNMINETQMLAENCKDGNLSYRADTSKLEGNFAEMVSTINQSFDAAIEPVKEAADVLENLSNGRFDRMVVGDYKGDHAAIKNALNATITALEAYVNEISEVLHEVSKGNLDIEITNEYKGEFSEIKDSINNIGVSLSNIFVDILNASDSVNSGASQVAASAQTLSQGSTEQAGSIEELTASIDTIATEIKSNSEKAVQANDLATSAKEDAIAGNDKMKDMLNSMSLINKSSENINQIIKVIDDIAFQTNILALNAAVEAARAGQYGKGFAVVAEEVRNLAGKSADAAKETSDLIEESITNVKAGTEIANQTADSLVKIVDGVTKASTLVSDIADVSAHQATGISQINLGITQVSTVVQQNAATSEESAAASQELSGQAQRLKDSISQITIKGGSDDADTSFANSNSIPDFDDDLDSKYGF